MLRKERLGKEMDPLAAEFTSSIKEDLRIFKQVIRVNIAHVLMLGDQGILKREEVAAILSPLLELYEKDPSKLKLRPELEDIHMAIEEYVVRKVGEEMGGKLRTAKSRNDQVATAIRLRLKEDLLEVKSRILELLAALVDVARKNLRTLMPGYTHLQVAEPTTFAHYLTAHAQAFLRDLRRLGEAYEALDSSPMGACALTGTSFPINREEVANLLGFERVEVNTMDAVGSRDTLVEALGALAISAVNLSRLAEEIILMSSSEFGFLEVSEEFCSTSSIMPQKKNQVVAELVRAKSSKAIGNLGAALSLLRALPQAYSLDFQELTPMLWDSAESTRASFELMARVIRSIKVEAEPMRAAIARGFAISTELANTLVRKLGLPFRDAHAVVAYMVARAVESGKSLSQISVIDLERAAKDVLGKETKIPAKEFDAVLDPLYAVESRGLEGGPAPRAVSSQLRTLNAEIKRWQRFTEQKRRVAERAERRLLKRAGELVGCSK